MFMRMRVFAGKVCIRILEYLMGINGLCGDVWLVGVGESERAYE